VKVTGDEFEDKVVLRPMQPNLNLIETINILNRRQEEKKDQEEIGHKF